MNFRIFEFQKSLHKANKDSFSSPHLIQLFDRYATYNGSNPYETSGIMTLIQHLENNFGTFVPEKGMVSISESLYNLAKRLGVKFYFDTPVSEIIVESKKVKGIKAKNSFIKSPVKTIVFLDCLIFFAIKKFPIAQWTLKSL